MTRLTFLPSLRSVPIPPQTAVVIYDARLERVSREFRVWLRSFPNRMPVRAGEELKDLARFPAHVSKFARLAEEIPARSLTIISVGGGSVGDFAGFLASVYKRGVGLVHVPSTWLSAIDSSHGGKTALNTSGAKNQIGTFYPADQVILVRSLLESQPDDRAHDAMSELAKIALVDGGAWTKKLATSRLDDSALIWKFLKPSIEAKMKIVSRDPRERSGHRQTLNLGHTFGHVIEAGLGWSHGRSIAQGLFFALELGEAIGVTSERDSEKALSFLAHLGLKPERPVKPLRASVVRSLLTKDKKRDSRGSVTFIFLKKAGRPERRGVAIERIIAEAKRLGWVGSR